MDSEDALRYLGNPWRGCWTVTCYITICLLRTLTSTWHFTAVVFFGATLPHRCAIPEGINVSDAIPPSADGFDSCHVYVNFSSDTNATMECPDGWVYGGDHDSIISEWDLVCNRNYIAELSQSLNCIGMMLGGLFMGKLTDRYGRRTVFLATSVIIGILTVSSAWVPQMEIFLLLRFLTGFFLQGQNISGLVLACELFSLEYRPVAGALIHCFWGMGMIIMAGVAYSVHHWRYLIMVMAVPQVLVIPSFFLLKESIPWLLAMNKEEEAKKVLKLAAHWNGVTLPDDLDIQETQPSCVVKVTLEQDDEHVGSLCTPNGIQHLTQTETSRDILETKRNSHEQNAVMVTSKTTNVVNGTVKTPLSINHNTPRDKIDATQSPNNADCNYSKGAVTQNSDVLYSKPKENGTILGSASSLPNGEVSPVKPYTLFGSYSRLERASPNIANLRTDSVSRLMAECTMVPESPTLRRLRTGSVTRLRTASVSSKTDAKNGSARSILTNSGILPISESDNNHELVAMLEKDPEGVQAGHVSGQAHLAVQQDGDIQYHDEDDSFIEEGFWDLINSRYLLMAIALLGFDFFAVSMAYFGMSLSVGSLSGNIYLNFAFFGVSEIIAYACTIALAKCIDRRPALFVSYAVMSVLLGLTIVFTTFADENVAAVTNRVIYVILKFFSSVAYGILPLYCVEIFPTTVRTQGIGVVYVLGRGGTITAPLTAFITRYFYLFPGVAFGITSGLAALSYLVLPETRGRALAQNIREAEKAFMGDKNPDVDQDGSSCCIGLCCQSEAKMSREEND